MPIREAVYLVQNGFPFEVAFSLEDRYRQAFAIIAGELKGGKFNWQNMEWEGDA